MEYVGNATNLAQEFIGVNPVTLKDLRKILKIGPVEIKILMNSYNIHNSMLYTVQIVLNGYLLKIFKMLLILPEVLLVIFIQLNGLKDGFFYWDIKNQKWFRSSGLRKVALKSLDNSSDISTNFLDEVIIIYINFIYIDCYLYLLNFSPFF